MKIDALVRSTDQHRRINARFVRVTTFKAGRNKQGQAVGVAKTYTPLELNVHRKIVPSPDRNSRYVTSITFLDEKLNVKVSCSCYDYMFRHEYANAQVGASDIVYGNGEAPNATNPDMRPGLCKHLVALRMLIKKKHGV